MGCLRSERGGGSYQHDYVVHIRGAAPGAGDFLCSPKESHQRKGFPGSPPPPRDLVRYPCATRPARRFAQLAHHTRYCIRIRREFPAILRVYAKLAQCSTSHGTRLDGLVEANEPSSWSRRWTVALRLLPQTGLRLTSHSRTPCPVCVARRRTGAPNQLLARDREMRAADFNTPSCPSRFCPRLTRSERAPEKKSPAEAAVWVNADQDGDRARITRDAGTELPVRLASRS